jgi:hypothetical protein
MAGGWIETPVPKKFYVINEKHLPGTITFSRSCSPRASNLSQTITGLPEGQQYNLAEKNWPCTAELLEFS